MDDKKGRISTYPEAGTVYSLDKKKKKKGTHPLTPFADEGIDQLYSQVDKKKKKGEVAAHLHTPVPNADIDQLYSQVDKKVKKKKSEVAAHPQTTLLRLTHQWTRKKGIIRGKRGVL